MLPGKNYLEEMLLKSLAGGEVKARSAFAEAKICPETSALRRVKEKAEACSD
jgi:hypothetical protein